MRTQLGYQSVMQPQTATVDYTPTLTSSSSNLTCRLPSSLHTAALEVPRPYPQPHAEASEAAALDSCLIDIESLERATGLQDVIRQVEDGDVERIRKRYGPQVGRETNRQWAKIKGAVTKRERLYRDVLHGDFGGDKDKFFAFFQTPPEEVSQYGSQRHKALLNNSIEVFRPFRLVVEAIPRRRKDIDAERAMPQYLDTENGEFSDTLWQSTWGSLNSWEIWRRLGKEKYKKVNQIATM